MENLAINDIIRFGIDNPLCKQDSAHCKINDEHIKKHVSGSLIVRLGDFYFLVRSPDLTIANFILWS